MGRSDASGFLGGRWILCHCKPPLKGCPMEIGPLLLVFAWALVCPLLAGIVADRKGRSALLWAFFGFALGVVGLLLVLVVPSRRVAI